MEKLLIVQSNGSDTDIALLEDKRLVELHKEDSSAKYRVGDIYLGRVRKIIPGLNAAFVDIGFKKDGFLHYTDMGPKFKTITSHFKRVITGNTKDPYLKDLKKYPETDKRGNIKDVLRDKQLIPVQIFKEPISSKGPRLTTEISIAGRYLILNPFEDFVGISKRLGKLEERKRLKVLIESLKPANFGVIVRTVAEGKGASELHEDLQNLLAKWELLISNLKGASPKDKVLSEIDKSSSLIRDLLNDNFKAIVTNNKALATDLQTYIRRVAPEKENIVEHYKGKTTLFDSYGVTKQIKASFGKTTTFDKGPYLVIEHTEAMHVIDVNSGHKVAMEGNMESNALKVNLQACDEIARQLRLRDIGGIVVIDFIDMRAAENRRKVNDKMKKLLKLDKATSSVIPLSRFNLMQITRERVRPQVEIKTKEVCPTCEGTGKIEASILLIDQIESELEKMLAIGESFRLVVHPFIEAYIKRGVLSKQKKWLLNYKRWIPVDANANYSLTEYHFLDKDDHDLLDVKTNTPRKKLEEDK